jgi:DNA-binding IscR family transcriptional regulator
MIKGKWLNYAVAVIKACSQGTGSGSQIAEDVGGSPSYVAKVIASLRHSHIIDNNYELIKPANQITIREIAVASGCYSAEGEVAHKVFDIILKALEVPVTHVW